MPNETTAPTPPAPAPAEAAVESLRARLESAKEKAIQAGPAVADETAPPTDPLAPVEAAPPAPPAEKSGAALAKLAREQRAAREAQEAVKRERAAFEKEHQAKSAALEKERSEFRAYQEAKANAKRFPLKFLEQLGLDPKDVNDALLNDGEPTANLEVKAIRDELEKFRQESAAEKQQRLAEQKSAAAAQEAEVLKAFQAQCASFVDSNAEKYEYTHSSGQQHLVFQVISEAHQASGRVLSFEEAADAVEANLEEIAEKYTATKKYTAKQLAKNPPLPSSAPKTPLKSPAQTKTLSNNGTAPGGTSNAQAETLAQKRARVYAKVNQA